MRVHCLATRMTFPAASRWRLSVASSIVTGPRRHLPGPLLAPGVAATTRPAAQAKGLGEYLRSRTASVPAGLAAEFM